MRVLAAVILFLVSISAWSVEKPSRDMIVAFCEDTDGPELSKDEVAEIIEYIDIPGTSDQLDRLYVVHLRGRLAVMGAVNDNAIERLTKLGPGVGEVPDYQFSCRKAFRDFVRENYLSPEEMEKRRAEQEEIARREKLKEEERIEAKKLALMEREEDEKRAQVVREEAKRAEAEAHRQKEEREKELAKLGPRYKKYVGMVYPRRFLSRGYQARFKFSTVVDSDGKGSDPEILELCIYEMGEAETSCSLSSDKKLRKSVMNAINRHLKESEFNTRHGIGRREFEVRWTLEDAN